ncbi:MAG: hypothetical protein COC12_07015 [Rhodobacteraceae bacterium]|nr:MAG: hypothetical protein COC12_07015 [Paracoccaceae bacterium]
MALSWPIALTEFFDTLPIQQVTCHLGRSVTASQTGGGDLISHQVGERLWQGQIILGKDYHRQFAAIEARIALLEESGASLLVYDTRMAGPRGDPSGALLGTSVVRIDTLDANNRDLTLKDLPAGYVISQGDLLGFSYGSNPVRYAFHRVVTGAIAGSGGITAKIEVIPWIRQGAATGTVVTLVKPVCKAKIMVAEYGNSTATVSTGGTLNWMQTLR